MFSNITPILAVKADLVPQRHARYLLRGELLRGRKNTIAAALGIVNLKISPLRTHTSCLIRTHAWFSRVRGEAESAMQRGGDGDFRCDTGALIRTRFRPDFPLVGLPHWPKLIHRDCGRTTCISAFLQKMPPRKFRRALRVCRGTMRLVNSLVGMYRGAPDVERTRVGNGNGSSNTG